jgi:hypothetical protein
MNAPNHGGWKLLSASSELADILREKGDLPQDAQPRGTVLAGDLSEMQPSDLLNFLHQGRRTGVLLTRLHDVERALVLVEGNVAWACSTSPGEVLGEVLVHLKLIERAQVEAALAGQPQDVRRVGEILVGRGLLGQDEVERGLRHQVHEIFLALLVAVSGNFVFLRGVDVDRLPAQLELDTQAMLLDGLRRLDEMELYRTRVPSLSSTPRKTGKRPARPLTVEETAVLDLADGRRSVEELASLSALGEFETTKAVYKLIEGGCLSL